jgi:PD-(D/E)XK endonuclease
MTRAPSTASLTGESGANLVLSRLQGWGIPAQASMPGIAYDLIADVKGVDMLRIQVKTRSGPKGQSCSFAMTRGCHYSKAGMFPYDKDDYDIAAFVCLSIGQVFFCPAPIRRIAVRATWLRMPNIDRETFQLALRTIQHRRHAAALSWFASIPPGPPPTPPEAPSQSTFLNF